MISVSWFQASLGVSVAVAELILVRRVHSRMKSENPQGVPLVLLGRYSPHEASKLLERFSQAGITFRAEPLRAGYGGSNGPTVSMDISVDAARSSDVEQIHRELFGDGLPNYDSSFFRDLRNV